ncbi:MAG: hypothetical protein ACI9CE_003089 [Flavobacterium sp.]|jgi:hypothetical protein
MRKVLTLISLILASVSPVLAQETNRAIQNMSEDEYQNAIPAGQSIKELENNAKKRKLQPPFIVPKGWHHDYDYTLPLDTYLNDKQISSAKDNKNTYVYLYSDWLEKCRVFRKSADNAPYADLFDQHNIILIDYNYFKDKFNIKVKKLPMMLKVNDDRRLGPETFFPVTKANQHPRKIFHQLRKFFSE